MKVRINNPKSWLAAVNRQIRFVRRSALPVLGSVLINADAGEGTVELTATDLDSYGIQTFGEVIVVTEGRCLVPKAALKDTASRFKDAAWIELESGHYEGGGKAPNVKISGSNGDSMLASTMPVEDYPKLPEIPDNHPTLSMEFDVEAFKRAAIAASDDDDRPILTGVVLDTGENGELRYAGTDSYRLAWNDTTIDAAPYKEWLSKVGKVLVKYDRPLIPAKVLADEIPRFTGENVSMFLTPSWTVIVGDAGTIMVRLIEGTFPNYRQLIPHKYPHTFTAPLNEWERGVKLMATMTIEPTDKKQRVPMRITVDDGKLRMSVTRQDVGGVETILAGSQGSAAWETDKPIAFSADYLGDGLRWAGLGLRTTDNPAVTMSLLDPLKPGLIEHRNGGYLLMPVRLP